jgi:hypothetical protein
MIIKLLKQWLGSNEEPSNALTGKEVISLIGNREVPDDVECTVCQTNLSNTQNYKLVKILRGSTETNNLYGFIYLFSCQKHSEEEVFAKYVQHLVHDFIKLQEAAALDQQVSSYNN